MPGGPWCQTFVLSDNKILFFHRNSILGTLDFTASAHCGHPLTFIRPQPRIFSGINFPCYLILKPYLSKRQGPRRGRGWSGPRPNHFSAPPPPLFALKRKIIKIKKDLKQVFSIYIPLYSLYFL